MNLELDNDEQIRRYLLGELPEAEQTQLEDRAFSDKEYLQRVQAVEQDLIDEYVRGELSDSERQKFEAYFLASNGRQRKVEFARAFMQVAPEYPAPGATLAHDISAKSTGWSSLVRFWRGGNLALGVSVAALVLIFAIAGVWLVKETRRRMDQARNSSTPPASPPVTGKNGSTPTPAPLAQNEVKPTPSPSNEARELQPARPMVATLLLLPGTARGAESQPQLVLPAGTTTAQLRLSIESGEPYKKFRAELRAARGRLIQSQSNLRASPASSGQIINWSTSANLLKTGEYELALSGTNDQGQLEPIGYYYFRVLKK